MYFSKLINTNDLFGTCAKCNYKATGGCKFCYIHHGKNEDVIEMENKSTIITNETLKDYACEDVSTIIIDFYDNIKLNKYIKCQSGCCLSK